MAEGRYEPATMSSFVINSSQLEWSWDTKSSNYSKLKKDAFDESKGKSWLVEDAEPTQMYYLSDWLINLVQQDHQASGYADAMGNGAVQAAADDLDALFGVIPDNALWVTRLHGELSREALVADLELGASSNQTPVERFLQAQKTTGTPPACPSFPECGDPGSSPGGGGNAPAGGWDDWHNTGSSPGSSSACAMTQGPGAPAMLSVLALTAALAFSRRRRRA